MITTLKTKTTQEDVYPNIQTSNIPDSGVTSAKIAPSAISASKIGSGAVTEVKIGGSAVTTTKIAPGAVTETKIANNAVTEAKIASGAVTDAKIDSVNGTKIYTDSIQAQKLQLRRFTLDKDYDGGFNALLTTLQRIFKNQQVLEQYREEYGENPYDTHHTDVAFGYSITQSEIYIRVDGVTHTIADDTSLTAFFATGYGEGWSFSIISIYGFKDIQ